MAGRAGRAFHFPVRPQRWVSRWEQPCGDEMREADDKLEASEAKVTELTASLADDAERVAEAAAKNLAEVGHESIEVIEDDESALSAEKVRERFDAMKAGAARSEFYKENRVILSK